MNTEILNCQKYLHPEDPVEVTSEDIKPYLRKLGWTDGDQIPSGMQEYTAAVLRILNKPVSMRSLPAFFEDEAVIITLKSALNKTKVYQEENKEIDDKIKEIVPNPEQLRSDAVDGIMELAKKAIKEEMDEKAKLDIAEPLDGFEDIATTDSDINAAANIKTDESDTQETHHQLCPRCMWDIAEAYEPYPVTEDDKLKFVYSVLGGTDFVKEYITAHGLLKITYKAPNATVMRLIENQIKIDAIKGRNFDYLQPYVNNNRYSLAASLYKVEALRGTDTNPIIPNLDDAQFVTPGETNLYKFTEYIETNIIKSSLRERFFRETFSDFMRLQVHLINTIDTENFSEAVLDKFF